MKILNGKGRPRGFTLIEMVVAISLVSILGLFIFKMMRNFVDGLGGVQRSIPLQRDLQIAKYVIEKDLLSAPRHSIGNAVPNCGFEETPTAMSTTLPPPPGGWTCVPYPPTISNSQFSYRIGYISGRPVSVLNGHYGLIVSLDDNRQFAAQSATFSLVGQNIYLFGVGIRTYKSNIGRGADSVLLGDPVPWPPLLSSALAITLASPPQTWVYLVSSFTAVGTYNYRVEAGASLTDSFTLDAAYDDIVVTPLSLDLTTTNGVTFEFDRFEVSGATSRRVRIRYRLAPHGNSGQLIRERRLVPGGPWSSQGSLNNIRRLWVGWILASPGLGPASPLPFGFSKGMNFPLVIFLESGEVGAPLGGSVASPSTTRNALELVFSVFPEAP
ncbi:MAG: prepilin-type N-terminal cleavage/methylation domain-containing protein [Elusimicrobia bacterium]|nr:prepilin-type N-terminal cleavage/methylation domain-containing protein [Elusimicrobiota bacterium]